MSTCFDIYTLRGDGCSIIQTYPSRVHPPAPPSGGGGGHPWNEIREIRDVSDRRRPIRPTDDDEIAVLIALGLL